jgi:toxin ParE2
MAVIYLAAANEELLDAIAYYESKETALGARFLGEVRAAVARVEELPDTWPKVSRRCQRMLVRVFPYGIIYQQHHGEIHVIAVAILHRREGYWRRRELR